MLITDTLTNLVTGMATEKDRLSYGTFAQRILTAPEIDALYSSDWIAGTIVDAPAEDETRAWRKWQAGQRQIGPIEALERSLNVRQKVRKARKMARKDGGSALLLGTGDADPSKPLNLQALPKGGLRYVHVFGRDEVNTGPLDADVLSPYFGEPEYYEVGGLNGVPARIHPSRMVRFIGQEALQRTEVGGWGRSILQRVYDAVMHAATASSAVASLTLEAKIDVYGVPGLTQNAVDPVWRSKALARFALANLSKSTNNAIVRDADETWEQKQINFGGLPEVVRLYLEIAAGASRMPVSRLLGKAPSGLNSAVAGDNETRAYYDGISSGQETDLRPALERLDEALIRSALGVRPASVWYAWEPLWQLTDVEKADIALKEAQATAIYAAGKYLPPSALQGAVRNQLIERGIYPGLEGALAVADATKEAPAALIEKTTPAPKPASTATE